MPARRARAAFGPIPPDLDLKQLVEKTDNFEYAPRIKYSAIEEHGMDKFQKLVLTHVIINGKPLVVDGYEEKLDPWLFTPKWLRDNSGDKVENARNLTAKDNMSLTIGHYLNHMGKLTDQFFENKDNYKDKNRQRIYLKDIDCPPVWQDRLRDVVPKGLFYWNDSTGDFGGPGATNEPTLHGASKRKGRGIAPAGDLMSSLPQEMRAENLMCYVGHEGTYTAAHREMCASLGQNIMVHTSSGVDESGNPEKPGSSIWFMTESKHRQVVSEYWLSTLGHDIELEDHYAQISAWQRAPFKVYVVEQKLGDLILIPPLAPHQVWNRGTCTIKVAWNRTTVQTLEHALHEALPKGRMVCRDEQYKNKAMIYYTLMKYSGLLRKAQQIATRSAQDEQMIYSAKKIRQLQKDFKVLFELFKEIMLSEMFSPTLPKEYPEYVAFDSNVTCSYCRSNIFNRFLTCKACPDVFGGDDPYDICMECFVMGRSCRCQSKFKWVEQFRWRDLCERYEDWRRQYIDLDQGMAGITPCTLTDERRLYPKKTTAQICQEQLRIRPFKDVKSTAPDADEDDEAEEEEEVRITAGGIVRNIVKKKSETWKKNNLSCHTCLKRHPKWTMAICKCTRAWCYGSLYRAHDLQPHMIMEDPNWECPHCRFVCSTGKCRIDPRQHPYKPKGTLLGHDTKKVADARSIESLVDFGVSNLSWIREGGDTPLERRLVEAEAANGEDADGFMDIDDEDAYNQRIQYSPVVDTIDPALGGGVINGTTLEQPTDLSLEDGGSAVEPSQSAAQTQSQYPELSESGMGQGYVDPSAVLHQPAAYNTSSGFTAVNDTPKGTKRRLEEHDPIRLIQPKKRKAQPEDNSPATNKASKQYQQEQTRKLLEQARREGRYLVVWGKLNKKSLMVNLNLEPETLRSFREREIANSEKQTRPAMEANVLLRSDIAPLVPESQAAGPSQTPKAKPYLARVEQDDDFRTRRRDKKHQPTARFEEIIVDEEDGEEADEEPRPTQSIVRDRSTWISRKHGDDPDLPDELPADWKDGLASRPRNRNRTRKSEPGRRVIAQKAPRIRPVRNSTGQISQNGSDDDNDEEEGEEQAYENGEEAEEDDRDPSDQLEEEADRAVELARLSLIEDDNRLAKLQAAKWANGSDEEGSDDATEQPAQVAAVKPVARATPSAGGSIMSRFQGKKIKIRGSTGTKRKGPPGLSRLPSE